MTPGSHVLYRTLSGRQLTGRIRLHGETWFLIDCDVPKMPMLISRDRIESVLEGATPSVSPFPLGLDKAVEPANVTP